MLGGLDYFVDIIVLARHRRVCWGYVSFFISVVVNGAFFVNKLFFYGVEDGK